MDPTSDIGIVSFFFDLFWQKSSGVAEPAAFYDTGPTMIWYYALKSIWYDVSIGARGRGVGVTRLPKSFSQNDLINSTSVEDFHVLFARVIFLYT